MMEKSVSVGFLAAVVLAFLALAGCGRTVSVIVTNNAPSPAKNLSISFTGGSKNLQSVGPGESVVFRLNPTGESDLSLQFVDYQGRTNCSQANVYLEHDYHGTILATIGPSNLVNWNVKSLPRKY
jgi:hypothetical protein